MCGISGIWNAAGQGPVDEEALARLTELQRHRGPDAAGLWSQGEVGLGHRRLSIIDLEGSNQPMHAHGRDLHIVFNGEIYNFRELRKDLQNRGHQFTTAGDTEVILAAYEEWGVECLDRLRGMFAFAIWDGEKRELFLARDRFGIKPICLYQSPTLTAFASEIQALDGLGTEFDDTLSLPALDSYLYAGYVAAPDSIFERVTKMPPGHYCVIRDPAEPPHFRRYWGFRFQSDPGLNAADFCEELAERVDDAVRSHLVSDVPVAAFLSGGIDSSVVVASMARQMREPVRTFTAGYSDVEHDERGVARRSASIMGVQHTEQELDLDVLHTLDELVAHSGEPFADSSAICTYHVCGAAAAQVKVMLSGDGGDEIFGGYSHYGWMLSEFLKTYRPGMRSRLAVTDMLRKVHLLAGRMTPVDAWIGRNSYFNRQQRRDLWKPHHTLLPDATQDGLQARFSRLVGAGRNGLLDAAQELDASDYLPYNNLNKVDIASMCHGLEVRVPLLDHELVEFAARIPWSQRVAPLGAQSARSPESAMHGYVNKLPLRKVAEKTFGFGFFDRTKMGFALPLDKWLASDAYQPVLAENLLASSSPLAEYFDTAVLSDLVSAHASGQRHGLKLWSLLFLSRWLQRRTDRSRAA